MYAFDMLLQMLMKQQAGAMVAARESIVAGAMGIVRDALVRDGGIGSLID